MTARLIFIAAIGASVWAGCRSTEETGDRGSDRTPRRVQQLDRLSETVNMALAPVSAAIQTVQLYEGDDESRLPIIGLKSREVLILEFDLMERGGRPMSVYFEHADRSWRRDLTPAQYLGSFQRDQLLDYRVSLGGEVPYVHYRYRFPNDNISFLASGNYILRVTDGMDEQRVLFEKPFFITEQATPVDLALDGVLLAGMPYPGIQPTAVFTPPTAMEQSVFNYAVCFAQNGRFTAVRCTDQPSLMRQPALQFYLQPRSSFAPAGVDYFLDLSILQAGGPIDAIDFSTSPFDVLLHPDYARFGSSDFRPLLAGQPVVDAAVRSVAQPDTRAEYVSVRFAFVPPGERRMTGDIHLTGAFGSWSAVQGNRMDWFPDRGRYELTRLVKQGQYEYRYVSPRAETQAQLEESLPRSESLITAFVYYDDLTLLTDRLIAVGGSISR